MNSQVPAPRTQGTAVGQPDPGALYRAHHDEAKNLRAGRIFLKYSKGDWFIGKDAEQFPDNEFYFVPAMDLFERGWQCWKGGRPVDERFVPYGTPAPLESTLPDHSPYPAKNDGWMEALKFPLIIVPHGKNTTAWLNVEYAASSAGGKNMVFSLSKQFSEKIKLGEITQQKCFVLCRAGTDHYMHKEYGRVHYPTVEIVSALSQDEVEKLLKSAVTTNGPPDADASEATKPVSTPAATALDSKPVKAKITATVAPAAAPAADPGIKYAVIRDGKSAGPYTLAELADGVEANWFAPGSKVWTKGMKGWVAAETVEVLKALFEPAEEEAPPPAEEEEAPPPVEEETPPPPPAAKKTNRKKISV